MLPDEHKPYHRLANTNSGILTRGGCWAHARRKLVDAVIGRRNWLYSASPRGAHASAFMYSLAESAKACGLEPRAYLQALFERYPLATTMEQRRRLLPMFFENS